MEENTRKPMSIEQQISEFDQYFAFIIRTVPSSLKSYYDALIREGFDKHQAFELVREFQRKFIGF